MSLQNTTVFASLAGGETFTAGQVSEAPSFLHQTASASVPLTNGSGSGQAQRTVKFQLTVTSGTTIDLTALSAAFGLDGGARNFSAIKGILIESTGTNGVTIAPGASNGWAGINAAASGNPLTIEPGGYWSRYSPVNGLTVDGTHKTILIAAVSGTETVTISLVGVGS